MFYPLKAHLKIFLAAIVVAVGAAASADSGGLSFSTPSLWEPEDLPWTNQQTAQDTRQKLLNSFYFIADFVSETLGERPRNWVDPQKNVQKAFELGYPQPIKRPAISYYFPVYILPKLTYFNGDDRTTAAINVCQSYWIQLRYQETFDCFAKLQMDISKKNYPVSSIQKMQLNLLQGFFLLHILSQKNATIKNVSFTTDPPTYAVFKKSDMQDIARMIFYYVTQRYQSSVFLPAQKLRLKDYDSSFFENPFYLIDGRFKPHPIKPLEMQSRSQDALTWVQEIMPLVYLNVVGFHNTADSWSKGFAMGQKLEAHLKQFDFPPQKTGKAFVVSDKPQVKENIYLKPLNHTDALVMVDLYRALALQQTKVPDNALSALAQGILRKGDPALGALLFSVSASAYFDLNILQLARRSYAWSELYDPNFTGFVPAAVFFGAESAFWLGKFEVAKRGFQRFLMLTSDKEYGPQAFLRLASIEQQANRRANAQSIYEQIVRSYPTHPASREAAVHLFCLNFQTFTPHLRQLEYDRLQKQLTKERPDVRRQAKACLTQSALIAASQDSFVDTKHNAVQKAQTQKNIIQKYQQEFPDNEFMSLFQDREKHLDLAKASVFAWENKCASLIDFYKKNAQRLNDLSKYNNVYVAGLEWNTIERKKLLRCAALREDVPLWEKARSFDVGHDGGLVAENLYALFRYPSSKTERDLFLQLKQSVSKWDVQLKSLETATVDIVDWEQFWQLIALKKFLNYRFISEGSSTDMITSSFIKDIMQDPKHIFEHPLFCSWFLQGFDRIGVDDLDVIAGLKSAKEWQELLTTTKSKTCPAAMAQTLLTQSFLHPSPLRDGLLLEPDLKRRGYEAAAEDWLRYAQRLGQERGEDDPSVLDIYEHLEKSAKDKLILRAVDMWFRSHVPKRSHQLLW